MLEFPFRAGQLIKVLIPVSFMRGTVEDNTGEDTINIEPDDILLVSSFRCEGRNPYKKWWCLTAIHLNTVCWRIMGQADVISTFEVIPVSTVSTSLQDRMLDNESEFH